jgi:hypothetical protein
VSDALFVLDHDDQASGGSSKQGPSCLACFGACVRQHHFRYRLGRRVRPEDAQQFLVLGSLVHLECAYIHAAQLPKPPRWLREVPIEIERAKVGRGRPAEIRLATDVGLAYRDIALPRAIQPLAVEYEFWCRLGDLWPKCPPELAAEIVTCRADMLVLMNGYLWIVDHKCLPADATVHTSRGTTTIGALAAAGERWTCSAWINGDHLQPAEAEAPVPAGVQSVYTIKLKSGRTAAYGANHPILTRDRGFVRADALVAGDEVAVAMVRPPVVGAEISDAMLTMIGLMLADGGLTRGQFIFTKGDVGVRASFTAALDQLGMVQDSPDIALRYSVKTPAGKTPYIRAAGQGSRAGVVLDLYGVQRVGSAEKSLPPIASQLSKRQVGVLLGALWSGDGSIAKGGNGSVRITYGSRSHALASGILDLLTQLGIVATLNSTSVEYRGSRRPYFFTTVVGHEAKRAFLQQVLLGKIPISGVRGSVAHVGAVLALLDARQCQYGRSTKRDGHVWWDRVESSTFRGRETVYDVTVPEHHTFVADGLVTHNTSVPRTQSFARMDHGEFLWQGMVNLHIVRAHLRRIGINVNVEGFIIQRIARRIPTLVDLQVLTIPARAYAETPRVMAQIIRQRRAVDVAIIEAQNLSADDQFDLLPTPPAYWACGTRYGPCAYTPVCYAERPEDRLIILQANYEKVR